MAGLSDLVLPRFYFSFFDVDAGAGGTEALEALQIG